MRNTFLRLISLLPPKELICVLLGRIDFTASWIGTQLLVTPCYPLSNSNYTLNMSQGNFELDRLIYENQLIFTAIKFPDLQQEIIELAIDYRGNTNQKGMYSHKSWLSTSEECLSDIGHSIDQSSADIEEVLGSITQWWRTIIGGIATRTILFLAIFVWCQCSPIMRPIWKCCKRRPAE